MIPYSKQFIDNDDIYYIRKATYPSNAGCTSIRMIDSLGNMLDSWNLDPITNRMTTQMEYSMGHIYISYTAFPGSGYDARLIKTNINTHINTLIKELYTADYDSGKFSINANGSILWNATSTGNPATNYLYLFDSFGNEVWQYDHVPNEFSLMDIECSGNNYLVATDQFQTGIIFNQLHKTFYHSPNPFAFEINEAGEIVDAFAHNIMGNATGYEIEVKDGVVYYVYRTEASFFNNGVRQEPGVYVVKGCN